MRAFGTRVITRRLELTGPGPAPTVARHSTRGDGDGHPAARDVGVGRAHARAEPPGAQERDRPRPRGRARRRARARRQEPRGARGRAARRGRRLLLRRRPRRRRRLAPRAGHDARDPPPRRGAAPLLEARDRPGPRRRRGRGLEPRARLRPRRRVGRRALLPDLRPPRALARLRRLVAAAAPRRAPPREGARPPGLLRLGGAGAGLGPREPRRAARGARLRRRRMGAGVGLGPAHRARAGQAPAPGVRRAVLRGRDRERVRLPVREPRDAGHPRGLSRLLREAQAPLRGPLAMAIEAVVWDYGGVFSGSPFGAMAGVAREMGVEPERYLEIVFGPYDRDTEHPWHRLERGEITLAAAREAIVELGRAEGIDSDPLHLFGAMGRGGRSE